MKRKTLEIAPLLTSLKNKKIMMMADLKITLGSSCRMTVLRKMKELDYITSYSHSGKFYSLKRIARYNRHGIWSCQSAMFSKVGTLKKTIEFQVDNSAKGFSASELHKILKVKVDDVLLELVKNKTIIRKKMSGIFIYYSAASNRMKKQVLTRKDKLQSSDVDMNPDVLMHELKAALIIFYSTLNEKQRRLYAGYESLKIGHGGDKRIGELLDIDKKTVAKGRQELLGREIEVDNIRESGGGRKSVKKNSWSH
jgi:hypothetical protein